MYFSLPQIEILNIKLGQKLGCGLKTRWDGVGIRIERIAVLAIKLELANCGWFKISRKKVLSIERFNPCSDFERWEVTKIIWLLGV